MKKNVVFWCGVNNPEHADKYDSFKWFEYSKQSWKYWCENNDVVFFEYTTPSLPDLMAHRVTWQRWFDVFNQLEAAGIDYNKIYMIDANSIIKWDTPNFFDLCTDDRLVAWRDSDNLNWIYECVKGWDEYFQFNKFNISRYINAGCLIINETHKPLIEKLKSIYFDDHQTLMKYQHTVKKGSDQGPLNFLIQMNGVEVNMDLPLPFKLTHLHRKDLFQHNWQLNIDKTPFFIKYGYIWIFNGFAKDQRTNLMSQAWNLIKNQYDPKYKIVERVSHKNQFKNSTSRKFKRDLIDYFTENKYSKFVELGCCHGDTTAAVSELFDSVHGYDYNPDNISYATKLCSPYSNVTIELKDCINQEWDLDNPDVIFFDYVHDQTGIINGLNKIKTSYPNAIVVMDDYGHIMDTVKPVINNLIKTGEIEVLKTIGESAGYKASNEKAFVDVEGLIFKFI